MIDTDEALVRRAQQQDRAAFEELVRRTARLLYAHLYLEIRDSHFTEDLVQETFLQAWRSIRQMTNPRGFRPWLLTIAHSVRIDAARRESRKKRTAPDAQTKDATTQSAVVDASDPAEMLEQREAREKALDALRELPDEYRLPITLRYLAGADYDAISAQLGLSNGSLRGLLNRGMARLRERLKVNNVPK